MQADQQVAAYAAADFSAGDSELVNRLIELCDGQPGERLLDLGCGPGNISFLLAERFPAAQVVAIDGAAAMLQVARARLAEAPERWPRLSFVQALLVAGASPLPGQPPFSALLSNSLLHHLHDPQVLWSALKALAAPGALVCIKDLRRPPSPEAAQQLLQRHLPQAPAVLQHDYIASLHAAFTPEEVVEQLQLAGLDGWLQVHVLQDRYLEVSGHMPRGG